MSNRIDRLKDLSKRFPDAQSDVAKKQSAALNIQARGAAKGGKAAAQQLAGKAAEAQSGINLGAQQAAQQGQVQLAGQMVKEQGQQQSNLLQNAAMAQQESEQTANIGAQKSIQSSDIVARKKMTAAEIEQAQRLQQLGILQDNRLQMLDLEQREALQSIGENYKDKLFDAQMRFEQDELGRKFSNERQLADYAVLSAKTNNEFESHLQDIQQTLEKDLVMMDIASQKLTQALEQGYNDKKQKLDQQSKRRIQDAIRAMEKEKARKAQMGAAIGNIMSGAAAGAAFGPPGIAVGAAAGLGMTVAAANA